MQTKPFNILIIDDDLFPLTGHIRLLESEGYHVNTAQNGADGLCASDAFKPDLIFLDVVLPDIDGYEICRQIKAKSHDHSPYIVMFSARETNSDSQIKGFETGADDFLTKPIDRRQFLARTKAMARLINTEASLKESQARFKGIFDHAKSGIIIYQALENGNDFKLIDINEGAQQIDKLDKSKIIGQKLTQVLPGANEMGLIDALRQVLISGNPVHLPLSFYQDDRIKGYRDNYLFQLPSEEIVSVFTDETDKIRAEQTRQNLEEQLAQAQKMEAIGTLAGGIAHDFNNILSIILGNTEMALEDLSPENPAYECLEESKIASLRAKDLVRQILDFSRKSQPDRNPTNLVTIIEQSVKLIRASIPTSIKIDKRFLVSDVFIMANPTQINQILLNLCSNASYAMNNQGILKITLDKVRIENKQFELFREIQPGHYAKLSVSDTGHGIQPEIINRIFDPYFTTKELGKGSGMGLPVVYGVIRSHGGTIRVDSQPGRGTTFEVYLPICAHGSEPVAKTVSTITGGTEKILFVDDEPQMVQLGKKMLTSMGYQVVGLCDAVQALETIQENPSSFDLVITDMTMPDLTGEILSEKIRAIRPDLPIILCTGYTDNIDEPKAFKYGISKFMIKPLSKKNLARAIREVLP